MELNTMYIVGLMADCHDLSFLTFCRYFQAIGKTFPADYPGMVSSNRDFFSQPFKKQILVKDGNRSLYPMIYFFEIFQTCSESFADGLMTEADTQNAFGRSISFKLPAMVISLTGY